MPPPQRSRHFRQAHRRTRVTRIRLLDGVHREGAYRVRLVVVWGLALGLTLIVGWHEILLLRVANKVEWGAPEASF